MSENTQETPTVAQLNSACLSYRHDFGLLAANEQQRVRFEAQEWLRAWRKEFDVPTQPMEAAEAAKLREALEGLVRNYDIERQWHNARGGDDYPDNLSIRQARAAIGGKPNE